MGQKTKVLITGGSGLLATNLAFAKKSDWEICLLLRSKDVNIPGVTSTFGSIEDLNSTKQLISEIKPDIVIHTAGLTNVDRCETDTLQAYTSNVLAAENIAKASAELNIKMVHISTDHFSDSSKPYSTESEIDVPVNNYAKTKLDAEYLVRKHNKNALIIRTNFFGWGHEYRKSFSDRILLAAREEREIGLSDSIYFTPILVTDLVEKIQMLVSAKKSGIYNVVGGERLSKLDFGKRLLNVFSLNPDLVVKASYDNNPNNIPRPTDMSLSCKKLEQDLSINMSGVDDYFQILKRQEEEGLADNLKPCVSASLKNTPINYGKQSVNEEDIKAVITTLQSSALTQGPKIPEFEQAVAKYVGAKYAVAVSNLTSGMHIACLTAGLGKGDYLITSPISFVASSNCAIYCGATPLFADIDPETLNMDPKKVEELCQKHPNVKAIVPVHFGGAPCDMPAIREIADRYDCVVIEDAAHGLGGRYSTGEMIGSCGNSEMTGFSFHPVKSITTGEGGVLTTNDEEIYKQLCRLRSHGINKGQDPYVNEKNASTDGQKNQWYYEMQQLGFNYRISDFQCALGTSQLKRISEFHGRRVQIGKIYDEAFADLKNANIVQSQSRQISGNHLYVLMVDFEKLGVTKPEVFTQFRNEFNIGLHVHYIPIPMNPYYQQEFDFPEESYENAVSYYKQAVTLPMYPAMSDEDIDRVVHAVTQLIG